MPVTKLIMMHLQEDVLKVEVLDLYRGGVLSLNFFYDRGRGVAHAHEGFIALHSQSHRAWDVEAGRQWRTARDMQALEVVLQRIQLIVINDLPAAQNRHP